MAPGGSSRSVNSLQGKLLVSSPSLVDPNFRKTVVLVAHHDDEGAMGLVLSRDRKSTRLNSSHSQISYAVFCLKKKKIKIQHLLLLCENYENMLHVYAHNI